MNFKSQSSRLLTFLALFILFLFSYFGIWKKNRVTVDAPSYYTYLPALIIHGDLHLDYIKSPQQFGGKVWFYRIEDGKKLIKHPMGVSVLLSPFFVLGHLTAKMTNSQQDGYSMPYQNWVSIGVLVYLFVGLHFLRKLLLEWFSETITAVTLLSIVMGTNLLWYSTQEGFMPHAVTFSMWCMALYAFFHWLRTEQRKYLLYFGAAFGFIVLIRPLSIAGILFFLLYGIVSKGGVKAFLELLRRSLTAVLSAALIAFVIASLQLCYWKYATGHWFYDVYRDEHFLFDSPQMLPFLFSFRKGVFIYTPILLFCVIGLIVLFKKNKAMFWSIVPFMFLTIYLLSSWWAWSYGICWGMRPMIDYYSILAFPMAAGINYFFEKMKVLKLFASLILILFLILNLFQTWQYKNGLIHYDDMSRKAYFFDFFRTKATPEWVDRLEPYDWDRRIAGLDQIEYSEAYFRKEKHECFLRGNNLKYIGVNERAFNAMGAVMDAPAQKFWFEPIGGTDSCRISFVQNSSWWFVNPAFENAVTASGTVQQGIFAVDYLDKDDNRIAIRARNAKYISIGDKWPFVLQANADKVGPNEIFRYFVRGK